MTAGQPRNTSQTSTAKRRLDSPLTKLDAYPSDISYCGRCYETTCGTHLCWDLDANEEDIDVNSLG